MFTKKRKPERSMPFLKRLWLMSCLMLSLGILHAQVTPPGADSDGECGADCWDLFDWGPVQDGSGNTVPNYGEGTANDASCNTTIDATVEYEGTDANGIDLNGNFIGANMQGSSPWTDTWTLGFAVPLTNPVIQITDLFGSSEVCITDCNGTPISLTDISTGTVYAAGCFMGNDEVQLSGTFDCIILTVSNDQNDLYDFSVGTCLSEAPLPPCIACGPNETFNYLTLANATGSGTGTTADVLLDGILYGDAEVLFSDLDINEDLSGNKFGAFDNDGGIFVLQINLCEPITVQQVNVIGLETESMVWVGSGLTGSGSAGIPNGLTLTQCGGSNTMMPVGNMVTNTNSGTCNNQSNGNYTTGGATLSTLYFRYENPTGGCVFDKATFQIGACVPDLVDVVPVCPLTELTLTNDPDGYTTAVAGGGTGAAFTYTVTRDANGNYFNQNCDQIENEVTNGIAIPQVAVSPCAEIIDETDCAFCTPIPPCDACGLNEAYEYLTLANATGSGTGTTADVLLNGVLYGDAEVLFSDLDINEDLSGSKFGAFDNDGGVFLLQVNLCEPITIQQVDIIGLETESQVWVGSGLTGAGMTGIPNGLTLTQCGGSNTMVPVGNMVTNTNSSTCNNQSNGNYTTGGATLSTLYFRYTNPTGGCRFDKATFRIGVCVPDLVMAAPTCPLSLYEIDEFPSDPSNATTNYYQDANGNWFPASVCSNPLDTITQTVVQISPCASTTFVELCSFCCELEVTCPPANLGTITCNDAIPTAATSEAAFETLGGVIADDPGFCGTLSITSSDEFIPPTDICNGRVMTRTYTISDDETTVMCVQMLVISAPNPPVISCPANVTLECTDDTSVAANGTATATADCNQAVNVTLAESSTQVMDGSCGQYNYVITRVWTATDDCGREDVCTQTITIQDTTNPIAPPAPAPITIQCANEIPNIFELTATDNCAPNITVFPVDAVTVGNCPSRLSIVRTWTFVDPCGNTAAISQNIEVIDNQPIMIQCPPTQTVGCSGDIMPQNNLVMVEMPCNSGYIVEASAPMLNSGSANCPGTVYSILYTVSDPCGRTATCSQDFIIENDPPKFVCPNEICYVECDTPPEVLEAHFDEFLTKATVITSCPMDINIVHDFNPSNLSLSCDASQVVTFTATDDCGRSTTCTVLIVIQDTNPPVIAGEITPAKYECDDNLQNNFNNWVNNTIENLNASDNCGTLNWNVSPLAPIETCTAPYAITDITFTATDGCGNTSAIVGQFYVANRHGVSILGNLADQTISCGETPEFGTPVISNTCGGFTMDHNDVTENTSCGYSITRTWTAVDGCGKVSSRNQTIFVEDTEGPTFTNVPAGGSIDCESYPPNFGPVEVSDDCGETSMTFEDVFAGDPQGCASGTNFEITRIWTAMDQCGNTSTASQSFAVIANKNGRGGSIKRSSIVVTPNPTSGALQLSYQSDESTKISIKVLDILGRTLLTNELTSVSGLNEQFLDLSNLNNATYILILQSGNEIFTQKIVKID